MSSVGVPVPVVAAGGIVDDTTTKHWKELPSIYPCPNEIALALQDEGVKVACRKKNSKPSSHKFPLIEKLAMEIYKNIRTHFHNPDGLTMNPSRGKLPLYRLIIQFRRHVDVYETAPLFHPFARDGKVYLLTNNTTHCGLDRAVGLFQEYVRQDQQKRNAARTNNDGLRIGCILLDPLYRDTVAGMMTKRRTRTKSDITGDPNLHFFEKILTDCFLNQDYVVNPPPSHYFDEFTEEDKAAWDPNEVGVFEHHRDGVWLKSTWEEYVRPKYKKALDKWNKDTGGGDGTPPSFINFCGTDRWLV